MPSTTFSAIQTSLIFVVSLLTFASLTSYLLRRWRPANETFSKVSTIIKSWWFIALPMLLALCWKRWGLLILTFFITLFVLREFLKNSRTPHKMYLGFVLGLLCSLQYLAIALQNETLFFAMLPVLCLWIVPGLVISQALITDIELVSAVGMGLTLNIYYLSHLAALTSFPQLHLSEEQLTYAPLLLIVMTWSNDVFQFIAGKMFGKRKIVPNVSPNKTLGGFIGGIVGTTTLASVAAPHFLGIDFGASVLLGILVGGTGMFGDLYFSAVKRRMGVKDFSQLLPGHGGLLDRMDSLVFTAPIYFHFLLFIKG